MIRKEVDEREGKNMSVCKERAWETLKKLSFERVTGTKEELKAANILKEECEKDALRGQEGIGRQFMGYCRLSGEW